MQFDLGPLVERIAEASCVFIGEATHGTREFYDIRCAITRRLIEHHGFDAVAIEGDWPDAYRVNRFVRHIGGDVDTEHALADFARFPTWMWRNTSVSDFVMWLRAHNAKRAAHARTGFYGLDLYSLYRSIEAVIDYLERADPAAAMRARRRYECFLEFGDDPQGYGRAVTLGLRPDCAREAVEQLADLRCQAVEIVRRDGMAVEDEHFFAEENARIVSDAETYYRQMFVGEENTWNLRDRHMAESLSRLRGHLGGTGRSGKVIVWAHNSHVGDARYTHMGRRGEINLGQLVREGAAGPLAIIGFTTHTGSVVAASGWGGQAECKMVRPSLAGSIERALHDLGGDRVIICADSDLDAIRQERLQRMIGVIYRPETERQSHYVSCLAGEQFDAIIHVDETSAVTPLDGHLARLEPGVAETFPSGL